MRSRMALVLLLAAEAAVLALAWSRIPVPDPVDWDDPGGWLARSDPETVLLAGGRLVAVALAAWLLATTLLAVVARACLAVGGPGRRGRAVARAAGRVAPAAVRHLVEGAIAVSLVTAATAGRPALAGTGAQPYVPVAAAEARPHVASLAPVRDGRAATPAPSSSTPASPPATPPPTTPPPTTPPPTTRTVPETTRPSAAPVVSAPAPEAVAAPGPSPAPAPGEPRAAAPPAPDGRHLVVAGEHLWSVARDRVKAAGLPDDAETVTRYWRSLCDANRDVVASGDVNVVHPGEELHLPPVA